MTPLDHTTNVASDEGPRGIGEDQNEAKDRQSLNDNEEVVPNSENKDGETAFVDVKDDVTDMGDNLAGNDAVIDEDTKQREYANENGKVLVTIGLGQEEKGSLPADGRSSSKLWGNGNFVGVCSFE